MSEVLTADEEAALARHEATIAGGVGAWLAVGDALLEICRLRLYRASHRNFELYCLEKWNVSRRRAYQLIEASTVAAELCTNGTQINGVPVPPPENERQARAIARVPAEHRAAVWEAGVKEAGGKAPSAETVAELLEQVHAWRSPEQMAEHVRAIEAESKKKGDKRDKEAQEGNLDWHLGRARWHLKQTTRHLKAAESPAAEDAAALDARIVTEHGDVTPRS